MVTDTMVVRDCGADFPPLPFAPLNLCPFSPFKLMTQSPAAYDPHVTQSFYDRISKAYDLIADSGERDARNQGIDALNLQAGESVLDIGYGTGSAVLELAKRVGVDGSVTGIDISPGMQSVAHEKVNESGTQAKVQLDVGSALALPYPDDTFDAVYTSFTLELFPAEDIPKVLAEARRVLKPDGRLGVVSMATVSEGKHDSVLEGVYKWSHHHFPHIVDCRPINLEKFVTDAGFEMIHDQRIEIWTMPVAVVVAK